MTRRATIKAEIAGIREGEEGKEALQRLRIVRIEPAGIASDRAEILRVAGNGVRPRGRCSTQNAGKNDSCDSYLHLVLRDLEAGHHGQGPLRIRGARKGQARTRKRTIQRTL